MGTVPAAPHPPPPPALSWEYVSQNSLPCLVFGQPLQKRSERWTGRKPVQSRAHPPGSPGPRLVLTADWDLSSSRSCRVETFVASGHPGQDTCAVPRGRAPASAVPCAAERESPWKAPACLCWPPLRVGLAYCPLTPTRRSRARSRSQPLSPAPALWEGDVPFTRSASASLIKPPLARFPEYTP